MTWCGINGVHKDVRECKLNHAICECGTQRYRDRRAALTGAQPAPAAPELNTRQAIHDHIESLAGPYYSPVLDGKSSAAPAAQPADSAMDALLAVVRAASKVSAMNEDGGDSLVGEAFSLWFAQWQSAWATLRSTLAALDALEEGK